MNSRNDRQPSTPISLKRLVKTAVLNRLLGKALSLAGAGTGIAVFEGDTLLADPAERFTAGRVADADIAFPLRVNGVSRGALLLRAAETGAGVPPALRQLGELLATTLQELIDRETARRAVTSETLELYRESAHLRRTTLLFNQSLRLDDVSNALLQQCQTAAVHAETGMLFGADPVADREWRPLGSFGPAGVPDLAAITASRLFQEAACGDHGEIINNLASDLRWQNEVPGLQSLICIPLKSPGHWSGALVLASRHPDTAFRAADLKLVATLGAVAATAMANAHHFEEVQAMLDALLQALATAIDSRDPCTAGHSRRVAQYSIALAQEVDNDRTSFATLQFTSEEMEEIYFAAMLHDVGKIGVKEEVLTKSTRMTAERLEAIGHRLAHWAAVTGNDYQTIFKGLAEINRANVITDHDVALVGRLAGETVLLGEVPFPLLHEDERQRLLIPRGNLTPEEWDEIRNHPAESYRILRHIPFPRGLRQVLAIISQHHEKLDGSGYPAGLHAPAILPQSRILAIADIYDALTAADRPYKRALPRDKALSILRAEAAAGKLDPPLVDLFCRRIDAIEQEAALLAENR